MSGSNVSHSNRHTKTRFQANVHKQTLFLDGKAGEGQDLQPLPAVGPEVLQGSEGPRRSVSSP